MLEYSRNRQSPRTNKRGHNLFPRQLEAIIDVSIVSMLLSTTELNNQVAVLSTRSFSRVKKKNLD